MLIEGKTTRISDHLYAAYSCESINKDLIAPCQMSGVEFPDRLSEIIQFPIGT